MLLRAAVGVSLIASLIVLGLNPAPSTAATETFETYSQRSNLTSDHADVFRLYWAFFDRTPDRDGAAYWVTEYDQCASLRNITWTFANSDEFRQTYGDITNASYVDLVYANVMDRTPDTGGRNYWLGLLDNGELDRSEVMLYFSLSDEFRTKRPLPSDGRPSTGCTPPSPSVSYANCTEVRAAGAAPIHRGEPGYGPHLDRDDDGIACE